MEQAQVTNKKNKKPRHRHHHAVQSLLNQIKEEKFNNRAIITERAKNYDALDDPYTSYYFSNKSVKNHLKDLKRSLRYEPNFTEKLRINNLINIRVKEKFQNYICPKTTVYQESISGNDFQLHSKKSTKSMNKKSSRGALNQSNSKYIKQNELTKIKSFKKGKFPKIKMDLRLSNELQSNQTQSINTKQQSVTLANIKKQNEQKIFADRLAQQLHEKKHQKWISFLEQKKKMLAPRQE